jgi:purine-binding chemotaxis protein CheW
MNTVTQSQEPGAPRGADEELDDNPSDTRQFVTFLVGQEVFAVDMAPVQEIIRMPDVVKLPLAPRTLDGLANLRGKVLPIISLRRIFGFDERGYDDSTRAIVIDLGQPLGFVVDRVSIPSRSRTRLRSARPSRLNSCPASSRMSAGTRWSWCSTLAG